MTGTYRIAIAILVAAALAVRLAALVYTGSVADVLESSYEHAVIARNLVEGRGFSWTFFCPPGQSLPTSQQAPLVPHLLAGAYLVFGVESPTAIVCLWVLQSFVSALTVLAIAETTRHLTGKILPALAAGAIACVYPPLIISAAHLQALVWNLAFLSFALWGVSLLLAGRRIAGALLFIPSSVGAWHSDPIIGAVTAALLAWLAWKAPRLRQTLPFAHRFPGCASLRSTPPLSVVAICAIAIVIGLAPWSIRNYRVHGRWMAVKSSLPYVLWQGNTAASHGTDKLCVPTEWIEAIQGTADASSVVRAVHGARRQAASVDQSLPPDFVAYLQTLPSEIDRMDAFGARIRAELAANPLQYLEKTCLRLKQWLWFDETNPRSYVGSYRASYVSLLIVCLIGLWLSRRRLIPLAPLLVAAIALTSVHGLVIASARFRIPLELLMIPPAGFATAMALQGLGASLARLLPQPAGARSKPFLA